MKKWIVSLACLFVVSAHAQENVTLHIGDPAPALKYSQWLKGTPVNSFKGDQLYILEFWATWCGPCKSAMPHLTRLQKQYEGKATFIGVDIWEKVKEGQPYESSLPMVTKFVNSNGAHMGYHVIADNNDQAMSQNWMKAAGLSGIPSTFIVQNEKVVWIGHPMQLDSILPTILKGSYDMKEFKQSFEKRLSERQNDPFRAAVKPVSEALQAKDYKMAIELLDKIMVEQPTYKRWANNTKFTTLLKYVSQEQAISFANAAQLDPPSILGSVYPEDGLAKTTYLWAAENFSNAKSEKDPSPMLLDALASCYAKGGDYKHAISIEKKAIKRAKTALKEGKFIGSIMDYTITEYEEALKKYRKTKNNN